MKLKSLYQEIIKKGIESDIRSKSEIDKILTKKKEEYAKLGKNEKEFFDQDNLFNPFADSRILFGEPDANIKSVMVGVDISGDELLLVDKMRQAGTEIDLAISHHPAGRAYAHFYEVMEVQADFFVKEGISVSIAQNLLGERKAQVERALSAVNHQRVVDIAKYLKINFLCMHTPADNLAYQYMEKVIDKDKPKTLAAILDILYAIPEYQEAAKNNNPPKIIIGNKNSRCHKIHLEFTGGTEGPQDIYEKLAASGIDTIIAMHQSEEHYKKCKTANINVIFASHIASDNLGINQMLDYLTSKEKLKIYEISGFRRFTHTK